jgi:hypothetical protein
MCGKTIMDKELPDACGRKETCRGGDATDSYLLGWKPQAQHYEGSTNKNLVVRNFT